MDPAPSQNGPPITMTMSGFFLLVFAPFAAGHFISYVLRTINAVLAPTLAGDLSLDAWQVGMITSAYFFAFALAQLPVGLALDRYGPRRVQSLLLVFGALGCLLFAISDTFLLMIFARVLIGAGLAACFMAALKAVSDWIPASRMPSIHGYFLAIGGLGAIASTLPAQFALEIIGWRGIFVGLAAAILATAAAIFLLSPEPAPREHRVQPTLRSLVEVYRNAAFRRTVFIVLVPHTAYFGIQSLWMGSWLHDVVGYSPRMIAGYLFAGMTAMVIGTIAVGHITQYASKRGYTTLDVAAIGLLIFAFVQLSIALDVKWMRPTAAILFPLFGAFAGLEFTIVAQSVPAAMTGRAATCLNLLIFTGSFCVQAGFGVTLGLWPHDTHGVYPAEAYQTGFGVLLFLQLPGLLSWLLDLLRRQNITPQTTPTECNPS